MRLSILNAHGGTLPRYQSNACQAWAILNSEERAGLYIHKMMSAELNSGDIVARDCYSFYHRRGKRSPPLQVRWNGSMVYV